MLKKYINTSTVLTDSNSDCKGDNDSDLDFDSEKKNLRFFGGNLKSFIFLKVFHFMFHFLSLNLPPIFHLCSSASSHSGDTFPSHWYFTMAVRD